MSVSHDWIKSTLGHGETMCRNCSITNREAAALGCLDTCDTPAPTPIADSSEAGTSGVDLEKRVADLMWAIGAKDKQILELSAALSAAPVAREGELITLLDDATVTLQGLIAHPDDKDSWDEANKLIPKLLSHLERQGDECCAHGVELHQDCYRCDEGSAAPVAQEPVAIQSLEWAEDDDNGRPIHRARTDVGPIYTVYDDGFSTPPYRLQIHQLHLGSYHNVGTAKGAAQADFDHRIRSALVTSPPAPAASVGAEEIARLVKDLKAASESLHHPPSIQSQRYVRAMNAMDRAAAILNLLSRDKPQS